MWGRLLTIIAGRPPQDHDMGPRLVDIWLVQGELLERLDELEEQYRLTTERADRALANRPTLPVCNKGVELCGSLSRVTIRAAPWA